MHLVKPIFVLSTVFILTLSLMQCTDDGIGDNATDDDDGSGDNPNIEEVAVGCDPDGLAPCINDWFYCETDDYGGKHCEGQEPAVPGPGEWECEEYGGMITCVGTGEVDTAGGWVCTEPDADGVIECRHHSYYPDDSGEGIWNCYYEGEFRICNFHETTDTITTDGDTDTDSDTDTDTDSDTDTDTDSDGDTDPFPDEGNSWCPSGVEVPTTEFCGDGVDNDCDGTTDEDCPEGDEGEVCECIEGAWRFCDTPDYCLWGRQYCEDDGRGNLDWGDCLEINDIPQECASIAQWYSPAAEACCIENNHCCQDMWDLDSDGNIWESLGNCVDLVIVCDEG